MDLNTVMRLSYFLGWLFAAIAVVCRGLEIAGVQVLNRVPLTSRGILIFAGFLFLATLATAAYSQAQAFKGRGASA